MATAPDITIRVKVEFDARMRRLIRWERHRRFLRHHSLPVPRFMLP